MKTGYSVSKEIANPFLVRQRDPGRLRGLWRLVAIVLPFAAAVFAYTWVHEQGLEAGYRIEQLERRLEDLLQEERLLELEATRLTRPERLRAMALEQLGMAPSDAGSDDLSEFGERVAGPGRHRDRGRAVNALGPRARGARRRHVGRLTILVTVAGIWMGAIGWRLFDLQIRGADSYRERAARQQRSEVVLNPKRGTIYDSRGRTMAVSVETRTLYAETAKVDDPAALAAYIGPLVGRAEGRIEALLQKPGHMPLARKLDRDLADGIDLSAFPGLYFLTESKREYPMGSLMAHVLGFVGTDRSLAGIELRYDDEVAGESVRRHVLRDGQQRLVVVAGSLGEPKPGADLHLTIDATIQHLAERALRETIEWSKAKAGNVVILAPEDSAVLAMASYPAFDPNQFGDFGPDERRNRALQDSYEPGSTFKTITVAGAFERQVVHADQIMDCGNGRIRVGKARINDHKPFPELTFRTAIAKSSNVCAVKAGLLAGEQTMQDLVSGLRVRRRYRNRHWRGTPGHRAAPGLGS